MTSMVEKERDRSMWVCLDCMAFPTTACECELRQSRRGAIYPSIGLTSFQIRKRCSRTRRRVRPSGSRRRASTTRGARSRQGRLPTWHCEMCLLSPKYHSWYYYRSELCREGGGLGRSGNKENLLDRFQPSLPRIINWNDRKFYKVKNRTNFMAGWQV